MEQLIKLENGWATMMNSTADPTTRFHVRIGNAIIEKVKIHAELYQQHFDMALNIPKVTTLLLDQTRKRKGIRHGLVHDVFNLLPDYGKVRWDQLMEQGIQPVKRLGNWKCYGLQRGTSLSEEIHLRAEKEMLSLFQDYEIPTGVSNQWLHMNLARNQRQFHKMQCFMSTAYQSDWMWLEHYSVFVRARREADWLWKHYQLLVYEDELQERLAGN